MDGSTFQLDGPASALMCTGLVHIGLDVAQGRHKAPQPMPQPAVANLACIHVPSDVSDSHCLDPTQSQACDLIVTIDVTSDS